MAVHCAYLFLRDYMWFTNFMQIKKTVASNYRSILKSMFFCPKVFPQ